MKLFLLNKDPSLPSGATVVWAPPSHGNVGQIAVDFIVSKYKAMYVGCIESELVMPISGYVMLLLSVIFTNDRYTWVSIVMYGYVGYIVWHRYCEVSGSKLICKPIEGEIALF